MGLWEEILSTAQTAGGEAAGKVLDNAAGQIRTITGAAVQVPQTTAPAVMAGADAPNAADGLGAAQSGGIGDWLKTLPRWLVAGAALLGGAWVLKRLLKGR